MAGIFKGTSTYEEVLAAAKTLLAVAGKFTLAEHRNLGQPELTSVNEVTGMAVRALAEMADDLQQMADGEGLNNVE